MNSVNGTIQERLVATDTIGSGDSIREKAIAGHWKPLQTYIQIGESFPSDAPAQCEGIYIVLSPHTVGAASPRMKVKFFPYADNSHFYVRDIFNESWINDWQSYIAVQGALQSNVNYFAVEQLASDNRYMGFDIVGGNGNYAVIFKPDGIAVWNNAANSLVHHVAWTS